jgi:hypothetical protein
VQANLLRLNEEAQLSFLNDLIQQKLTGPEKGTLSEADVAFHEAQVQRLTTQLEEASARSHLPETSSAGPALNDLLVRIRLK